MAIFFCWEKKNCSKTRFWNFAEIPTKWTWGRRLWPPECHQITLKNDFSVGEKKKSDFEKKNVFSPQKLYNSVKNSFGKKKVSEVEKSIFRVFRFSVKIYLVPKMNNF